jgi:hypothetical protein
MTAQSDLTFIAGHDDRGNPITYIRHMSGWWNLYSEQGPYTDAAMLAWFLELASLPTNITYIQLAPQHILAE